MKSSFQTYKKIFRNLKWGQQSAVVIIALFVMVALLSNFIANNRPIICKYENEIFLPAFNVHSLRKKLIEQQLITDYNLEYDWSIWPIIRYRPSDIDDNNAGCVSPFAIQEVKSNWHRHFLGTDELGRDIAAGMVHGTRIAFWVGIGATLISFVIGIILGLLGGYFGDSSIKWSKPRILISLISIAILSFWLFNSLSIVIPSIALRWIIFLIISILLFNLMSLMDEKINLLSNSRKISIPLDFIIQRGIELFQSIPGFFIILVALILISSPSLFNIIIIIGVLRWPRIAQYIRAESLRIREMPYIKNAQLNGHSSVRILRYHIFPSVLTSIVIHISFGIGTAILIESTISFLGLGLGTENLTWGAMLSESRKYFYAWWIAIFPGLAIFCVVYSFNILGEMMLDILNPLRRI